tara:strand:+ start:849 stop:1454 length:606 start_codon:yes stop_codon:yes gene_type:complete
MHTLVPICILFATLLGCETQKVEYRHRPTWHTALSGTAGLPQEETRADGTIVIYSSTTGANGELLQEYLDTIVLEEKDELTGEITLRSILPEHVLTHTLTCLRDRNWELLFEQIISTPMKQYYRSEGHSEKEFVAFFAGNRRELAKTLQRMHGGKGFGEVTATENNGVITYTFIPRIARNYTFKTASFLRENDYLKLHSVR